MTLGMPDCLVRSVAACCCLFDDEGDAYNRRGEAPPGATDFNWTTHSFNDAAVAELYLTLFPEDRERVGRTPVAHLGQALILRAKQIGAAAFGEIVGQLSIHGQRAERGELWSHGHSYSQCNQCEELWPELVQRFAPARRAAGRPHKKKRGRPAAAGLESFSSDVLVSCNCPVVARGAYIFM